MDVFLDNTDLVQELADREAQKIFGDAAPEVLMTHTSLRFTSDSYDQGWPYEKKQQFVQGTDPWCLDIAELKKVITDLDLIKDVSKPRSFYAAMKSESKQLWRYAEALEKK